MNEREVRIAIVGAGMAGLACATELARLGHSPTLFDKGRGPGGRMATRRVDVGSEMHGRQVRFDHGAQYFTARDPAFVDAVEQWKAAGIVAPWPPAGKDAMVGTPSMNEPLRTMADTLDVIWAARVENIAHGDGKWSLSIDGKQHQFDTIVIAIPAEQVAILLADAAPEFADEAVAIDSAPCWTVMATFDEKLLLGDALPAKGEGISWAARNSAKPGRDDGENWVIQASPDLSRELLELTKEEVAPRLLERFFAQHGIAPVTPNHLDAHRWRYAMVPKSDRDRPALWDATRKIAVAGDWLSGPRVENAYLSGMEAARLVHGR